MRGIKLLEKAWFIWQRTPWKSARTSWTWQNPITAPSRCQSIGMVDEKMMPVFDGHLRPNGFAMATVSSTHFLSPQRDGHHLPGHVHEMDGSLGHFPVGLGGEASHFVHSLAHSNHVCRERWKWKVGGGMSHFPLQRFIFWVITKGGFIVYINFSWYLWIHVAMKNCERNKRSCVVEQAAPWGENATGASVKVTTQANK